MKKKLGNEVPPVYHIDDLACMGDDEIWRHLRVMEEGRRSNRDPLPFEIEIAYLQRELGIRRDQRDAHVAWLRSGGDDGLTGYEVFEDETADARA